MRLVFFRTVTRSLSPFSYRELTKGDIKSSLSHFLKIFIIAFMLGLLLAIPGILKMPKMIESQLSKADRFVINVDFNTTENLDLPEKHPFLTITTNESSSRAPIVIGNEKVVLNMGLGLSKSYQTESLKDLKENRKEASSFVIVILIFLAPLILVYLLLTYLVKYILIIAVLSVAVWAVTLIMRRHIRFRKLLSAGFYSMTPLLLIDMATIPLNIRTFYAPLLLYAAWYIIICMELIEEF